MCYATRSEEGMDDLVNEWDRFGPSFVGQGVLLQGEVTWIGE